MNDRIPGNVVPAENAPGLKALRDRAARLEPIRMAVVHPCNVLTLSAAIEARDGGLIQPVLVAPKAKLDAVAAPAVIDRTTRPLTAPELLARSSETDAEPPTAEAEIGDLRTRLRGP